MTVNMTLPCSVRGCEETGVCVDRNNYTQHRESLGFPNDLYLKSSKFREVWYCQEHATRFLFPIIDIITGNTRDKILSDFSREGAY
jgi:hypothetical protein